MFISLYSNAGQKVFARSLDLTQGSNNLRNYQPSIKYGKRICTRVADGVIKKNK